MNSVKVDLTKEECKIIWDALCEATEDKNTIYADLDRPAKITALAGKFNLLLSNFS
jgi:hypothetical protein